MLVEFTGVPQKEFILRITFALIAKRLALPGVGYVVEYCGEAN